MCFVHNTVLAEALSAALYGMEPVSCVVHACQLQFCSIPDVEQSSRHLFLLRNEQHERTRMSYCLARPLLRAVPDTCAALHPQAARAKAAGSEHTGCTKCACAARLTYGCTWQAACAAAELRAWLENKGKHWQVCVCRRPGWGGRRPHPAPLLLVYMGRLQCAVQSNSNSAEFQPLNKSLCQLRLQYRRTPIVAGLAAHIAECSRGLQDAYPQPLCSGPVPTGRGHAPTCGNAETMAAASQRLLAHVPTLLLLPAPSSASAP